MKTTALTCDATLTVPETSDAMAGAADRAIAWFHRQRQFRHTLHHLSSLDDQMLADLGIARDQIWHVARTGRIPGWD